VTGSSLRVVHVAGTGHRGGAEAVLRTIVKHLAPSEFSSLVVCLQEGPLAGELAQLAPVVTVPVGRFRHLHRGARAVGRLRTLLAERRASVVHCHGTTAHLYGGLAARAAGVPNLFHVHDVPAPLSSGQGLVEQVAFRVPAERVVAVSQFVADRLPRRYRLRARVIPNGVDLDAREGAAASRGLDQTAIRRRFGWPAGCPLVVWCGRLQRWKGTHVFLEAAADVARLAPSVRFLVVGGTVFGLEPGYEIELRHLHRRLGLGDTLVFAGQQADVIPFLAAADLVVHSAVRPEPFGLVLLEAMALGTPIVAAAAGGVLELVEDGVSGVLVPPGDPARLARTIVDLLRDPARRARLGAAGQARVRAAFTAARMTRAVEALYREVVEPTGREL
jgi:glycosyltransferase involved in cell wall biosynthesis